MEKQKGFTLLEMLVVIAIIGILASVTLIGLGSARARARDARRIADLREVQNGLEVYYAKIGGYPVPAGGTWADLETTINAASVGISNLPRDPINSGNNVYFYGVSTDKQNYALKATLEVTDNSALATDVDGTVLGLGCDDPSYCVRL